MNPNQYMKLHQNAKNITQIHRHISFDLLRSETNYCLVLIKKFLEEIDWAHNFVQYVKLEFDVLLYIDFRYSFVLLSTMVLNNLIDIDKDLNNMLTRSNILFKIISCSNKLPRQGSLQVLHFAPNDCD